MKCSTIKSEQVWKSKDGERTIWEVVLKATEDGKEYKLKTYSEAIATEGWEGEVKSYLNPRGDRFVAKVGEDKTDSNNTHGNGGRDENAIRAQWAIGQASQTVNWEEGTINHFAIVEERAEQFFLMADRVKTASAEIDKRRAQVTAAGTGGSS